MNRLILKLSLIILCHSSVSCGILSIFGLDSLSCFENCSGTQSNFNIIDYIHGQDITKPHKTMRYSDLKNNRFGTVWHFNSVRRNSYGFISPIQELSNSSLSIYKYVCLAFKDHFILSHLINFNGKLRYFKLQSDRNDQIYYLTLSDYSKLDCDDIANFRYDFVASLKQDFKTIEIFGQTQDCQAYPLYIKIAQIKHPTEVKSLYFESDKLITLDFSNAVRVWTLANPTPAKNSKELEKILFMRLIQDLESIDNISLETLLILYSYDLTNNLASIAEGFEYLLSVYKSLSNEQKSYLLNYNGFFVEDFYMK